MSEETKPEKKTEANKIEIIRDPLVVLFYRLKKPSMFTRTVLWLYERFKREPQIFGGITYSKDLSKAMKIPPDRAIKLLKEVANFGLIRISLTTSNFYSFLPAYKESEGKKILVMEEFIETAKETIKEDNQLSKEFKEAVEKKVGGQKSLKEMA